MMEFVHRGYVEGETIAAVATATGEGGVAIVRISGKQALDVAEKVFSGPVKSYPSHTAHFGKVIGEEGELIDEALLLVLRAPRSYTGEDTVEIQCHGGSLITRKVLQRVLKAGARAANPGEFTFKAFLNGKLDLTQAEAVQTLISAQNELALQFAEEQLRGALSQEISSYQKELVDSAAILEAWVDFPEEGLEFASKEEIISALEKTLAKMQKLSESFHQGKKICEGFSLCLVGAPNAGKSSLLNALVGSDRAIVTEIPGTTRDLLEEEIRVGSLHLRLIDTAGLRKTDEPIEKEGIRRSQEAMKRADLVLVVLDASRPLEEEERELIDFVSQKKALLVWNKSDLPHTPPPATSLPQVLVSAKERRGLNELKNAIDQLIWENGAPCKGQLVLTNLRHKQALDNAILAAKRLIAGLAEEISPEFLGADMRLVLNELGSIIGTNVTEDILSAIFSKFCVGK